MGLGVPQWETEPEPPAQAVAVKHQTGEEADAIIAQVRPLPVGPVQ